MKVFVAPGTARKIIFVGCGTEKNFTGTKAGIAMRIAVQTAKREKIKNFCCGAAIPRNMKMENAYELIAINAVIANFEFVTYKTPPQEGFSFMEKIEIFTKKQLNI